MTYSDQFSILEHRKRTVHTVELCVGTDACAVVIDIIETIDGVIGNTSISAIWILYRRVVILLCLVRVCTVGKVE